jgi:uncharacterized membrane-anchored protein YhcB (DUF1043 family)
MQRPKDIVCEVCGKSLPREEFTKGKAVWVMGKNYCASCRAKLDEKERAAVRGGARAGVSAKGRPSGSIRPISKQVPVRGDAKAPQAGMPPEEEGEGPRRVLAPSGSRMNTIAVILVVTAVIGVIALILYKDQEKASKQVEDSKKAEQEKLVAAAREFVKTHPDDPSGVITHLQKTINELPPNSPFRAELKEQANKIAEEVDRQNRERVWDSPLKELRTALEEKTNERNAIKLAQRIADDATASEKHRNEARELILQFWLCLARKSMELAVAAKGKSPPDLEAALDFLNDAQQQATNAGEPGKELLAQIESEVAEAKKKAESADMVVDESVHDLIAAGVVARWVKSGPIKVERMDEWLLLRVPGGTSEERGSMLTPPEMSWRNFSLEISFSIMRKGFTLLCRAGREATPFSLDFRPPAFVEGNDYNVVITINGDDVKVTGENIDSTEMKLTTKFAPRGGIGFKLAPGAEVRVFDTKIRALPR